MTQKSYLEGGVLNLATFAKQLKFHRITFVAILKQVMGNAVIRVVDENKNIHCSLIMGKASVAPNKFVSIPRLEFAAAVLSLKILNITKKELQLQELDEYFWRDSRVVLGYIASDRGAFKTFVANRKHMIQENSSGSMSKIACQSVEVYLIKGESCR